jgi:hypothetical protein
VIGSNMNGYVGSKIVKYERMSGGYEFSKKNEVGKKFWIFH